MPHGKELKHIQDRRNLPTGMTSKAISRTIPPKIRAQSFFSARVAESNILSRFREITDSYMTGRIGRDEARNLMLEYARANNRDDGTRAITNLASSARLNLIVDQNASMARAVGDYERMYSSVNKKLFPYVIYHASVGSRTPRSEHQRYDGMIFEKDDPWLKTHWPPWDFNCHCRLENCTDKKAHKTPDLIQPPTPAEKVTVDTRSGYSFDPAHAFEKFDYDVIKDPDLQDKAKTGVEQILAEESPTSPTGPTGPTETREQHLARRQEQWNAAYQKRLAAWDKQMESVHLKAEIRQELLKVYTPEAAEYGRPPAILASPISEKTYLTPDGKTFVIGKDAKTPLDLLEKLKNLPHKLKRGKQLTIAKENRTRREAKLIGVEMIKGKHTEEQDRAATNPNFKQGKKWQINCQRCVTAYEARRRGINVEAKPCISNYDSFSYMWTDEKKRILDPDGWTSAYRNPKPVYCGAVTGEATKDKVVEQMKEWGAGARAIVRVQWRNYPSGHVFIAENTGKEIRFIDPQSNESDVSGCFLAVKRDKTFVIRVDNLKFRDNVKECCKEKK